MDTGTPGSTLVDESAAALMIGARVPAGQSGHLAVVRRCGILDACPEQAFDDLMRSTSNARSARRGRPERSSPDGKGVRCTTAVGARDLAQDGAIGRGFLKHAPRGAVRGFGLRR